MSPGNDALGRELADALVNLDIVFGDGPRSWECLLLVSTCRNLALTINALYCDLRDVHGSRGVQQPLLSALVGDVLAPAGAAPFQRASEAAAAALAAAHEKIAVWEDRDSLLEEVNRKLESVDDEVVAGEVRDILFSPERTGQQWDGQWDPAALRIDVSAPSELTREYDRLCEMQQESWDILRVLVRMRELLEADVTLFSETDPRQEVWSKLYHRLTRDSYGNWMALAATGGQATLKSIGPHAARELPTNVPAGEHLGVFLAHIRDLVASAIPELYTRLSKFEPNVARAPLPPPFVINLPVSPPIKRRRAAGALVVDEWSGRQTADKQPRVALLRAGLPTLTWFHNWRYSEAMRDSIVQALRRLVEAAFEGAQQAGAAMLAFPEYFLPEDLEPLITGLVTERDIGFVGGLEGRFHHGTFVNEALIALPGGQRPLRQRKHFASPYEPTALESDGVFRVLRGTRLGSFAVVMCYDLLEHPVTDVLSELEDPIDVLVVLAMNPYPDLFRDIARAESVRRYLSIAVAACVPAMREGDQSSGDGTLLAVPRREEGILEGERVPLVVPDWPAGTPELAVVTVPVSAVRESLLTPKPAGGFFFVPYSTRPAGYRHGSAE